MRKAEIKIYDTTAGWLVEDENGYHFNYDSSNEFIDLAAASYNNFSNNLVHAIN